MAVRGKSIHLFLMDGTPMGRMKCTLANWTGLTYKIPRTALGQCGKIGALQQSGVYFLFGSDAAQEPAVYIGQAGVRKNNKGLLYRIGEPHPQIDYWTEAVAFTTADNSFGPTEISYLENRFRNLAVGANRYVVKNGNDPNPGNITEEKESELEEFIDYAKLVMGTLGYQVFEPLVDESAAEDTIGKLHFCQGGVKAFGRIVRDGFVVLKGSKIAETISKSCPMHAVKNREKYRERIIDNVLQTDILFGSPSGAAAFVCGYSISGNAAWKNEHEVPLKELSV
ncbi:MAG: GIY-YIG nuclease family protein [Clostridia bacterium]|nr:GIY-YIG nuclease family protein [Clostridia bacterium]